MHVHCSVLHWYKGGCQNENETKLDEANPRPKYQNGAPRTWLISSCLLTMAIGEEPTSLGRKDEYLAVRTEVCL